MTIIKRPKKKPKPTASHISGGRWYDPCPSSLEYMANSSGHVNRARKYGAYFLGRELTKKEVVHHVNHDTLDDSPQNLVVLKSIGDHRKLHSYKKVPILWQFDWDSYYEGGSL